MTGSPGPSALSKAVIAAWENDRSLTRAQLAQAFGVTKSCIVGICKRHKIDPPHGKCGVTLWTPEQRRKHAELLQDYWMKHPRPKKAKTEKKPRYSIGAFPRHKGPDKRAFIRMVLTQRESHRPVSIPRLEWLERKTIYG